LDESLIAAASFNVLSHLSALLKQDKVGKKLTVQQVFYYFIKKCLLKLKKIVKFLEKISDEKWILKHIE